MRQKMFLRGSILRTEANTCSAVIASMLSSGVCAECSAILVKLDPIGINNEGKRICYKCSAMHDMADDE